MVCFWRGWRSGSVVTVRLFKLNNIVRMEARRRKPKETRPT